MDVLADILSALSVENWTWSQVLTWAHICIVLLLFVRVLYVQHQNGVAVAWLIILLAFPLVGVGLYLLFGEQNLGRRYLLRQEQITQVLNQQADSIAQAKSRIAHIKSQNSLAKLGKLQREQTTHSELGSPRHSERSAHMDLTAEHDAPYLTSTQVGLSRLAAQDGGYPTHAGNRTRLITDTQDKFDSIIKDIERAAHGIFFNFYIIEPSGRVQAVLSALIAAAKRGVVVDVLADSIGAGSFFISKSALAMREVGIRIHRSLPVGLFKTLVKRSDLRNHRKLIVIDNHIGYTGSFNLVDPKTFKQEAQVGKWVDALMRVKGDVVWDMSRQFVIDTASEHSADMATIESILSESNYFNIGFDADFKTGFNVDGSTANVENGDTTQANSTHSDDSQSILQFIPSAPHQDHHVIYETLLAALYSAKRSIYITTPYFVPDDALLLALTSSAKRGVSVTLIVPKKVDSKLVQLASQAYYPRLMDAGVKITRFTKGLLHTKTVVVDDYFALFGTVNMDMRSFYLNLELSLAVYDKPTVSRIHALQLDYLAGSEFVSQTRWQHRPMFEGFLENAVRLISPIL